MAAPASSSPIYNLRASGDGKSVKAPALSTVLLSNYVTTTNKTMWGIERKEKRKKKRKEMIIVRGRQRKNSDLLTLGQSLLFRMFGPWGNEI